MDLSYKVNLGGLQHRLALHTNIASVDCQQRMLYYRVELIGARRQVLQLVRERPGLGNGAQRGSSPRGGSSIYIVSADGAVFKSDLELL